MKEAIRLLREKRKRETKQLIFEQAVRLFGEKGYEKVTVQEIADDCGIAKGTFFNYFAKKEDILLHLGESQLELLCASLNRYENTLEPKQLIAALFEEMLKRYAEREELMRMAVVEMMRSALFTSMEAKNISMLEHVLEGIVDRAKEKGKLRSGRQTGAIVSALVGVYFQVMMAGMMDRRHEQLYSERLKEQLDIVWHGIDDQGRVL